MKKQKTKNYKRISKRYKRIGTSLTFTSTVGGFIAYESMIDWSNFKNDLENFIVVNPDTVKLNLAIAFPMMIAMLVFIWVYRKKNEVALKGKVAMPLLFAIILTWLLYSVIEATLCALIGAFVGAIIDEQLFMPLSNNAHEKSLDDHEIDLEKRRERARKKAREEIDGTV